MTVVVLWLFITVSWIGLQCVVVVLSDSSLFIFFIAMVLDKIQTIFSPSYLFCFHLQSHTCIHTNTDLTNKDLSKFSMNSSIYS